MLYHSGKFGELKKALTHTVFNVEEGGHQQSPVIGDKMLIEDNFDMLLEDGDKMLLEA